MSIQNIKSQIIASIDTITSFDTSKLYPESPSVSIWNNMDSKEIKLFVEDIISILKKIKKSHTVLNVLPPERLNDLNSSLNSLVGQLPPIESLNFDQITTQHHGALNQLQTISTSLRLSGLYTQLKLAPDLSDITKKLEQADIILKDFNPTEFKRAIDLVKELVSEKISLEAVTLKENLGTFLQRADEHKISKGNLRGQWWWMLAALAMGVFVAYIVYSFINVLEEGAPISTGMAILRVSSLVIPSYFMVFFVNQFLYHKKMYESYSFKNVALNTMTDLMKNHPDKRDEIVEKGLDVIFVEPRIKEGGKYNSQLVSELIGMLKTQLKK